MRFIVHAGLCAVLVSLAAGSASAQPLGPKAKKVINHWTPERRAAATPRDLYIDAHGNGVVKAFDGSFQPYGQTVSNTKVPAGKPSGNEDKTPPTISDMAPAQGATIGASHTFQATVTDASGVKSVSFVLHFPSGSTQTFSATASGDVWSTTLQGFTDGAWGWHVVAKDTAKGGGNTATSAVIDFTVDTGGGDPPPSGDDVVANAQWIDGGNVQTAAGRIYFEMPDNKKWRRWSGYVCSGTVITDLVTDRSIILTAAHCVYDDVNKAFARNVLFIPNQAGTSGAGTDTDCTNDPIGCWTTSFGAVDIEWATRQFPDNIKWDYAYYVVSATGAHSGAPASSDVLELATGALGVSFSTPSYDDPTNGVAAPDYTHALGYSYSDDPNFMYCAEDMTLESAEAINWWLGSCGLSGGASGGPWIQPLATETVMSVNSWGYTTAPGMAGPRLDDTTASSLMELAGCADLAVGLQGDGYAGVVYDPQVPPCQ